MTGETEEERVDIKILCTEYTKLEGGVVCVCVNLLKLLQPRLWCTN